MDQLAGQPPGLIQAEVAVLQEQRHLERRRPASAMPAPARTW
jgi:hypothetical protein